MVQVDLITGFLGAGKTTFLRRYVQYLVQQGHKVCILENDFGAVNVDAMQGYFLARPAIVPGAIAPEAAAIIGELKRRKKD